MVEERGLRMVEEGQHMDDRLYEAARGSIIIIPVDINDERLHSRTPGDNSNVLHVAARYGKEGFITSAVDRLGERVYELLCQKNSKGETPLHLAAQFGNLETISCLLTAHDGTPSDHHRPCWSETDNNGDTPLHKALRFGHDKTALLLLTRDAKVVAINNNVGESLAFLAAENICNEFLKEILDADPDTQRLSVSGSFGQTVVHSSRRLQEDIMRKIIRIRSGNLLKTQDNKGKSVIHYAVEEGRIAAVTTLLTEDNSLAYLPDNSGQLPLHIASMKSSFPMVKTILKLSPQSIHIRDSGGKTALHVAKMNNEVFLKKCLADTEMKVLINEVDNNGNTPLHVALMNSEVDAALHFLITDGCSWRLKNKKGDSPLDLCKSNINILDNITPIDIAIKYLDGESGKGHALRKRGRHTQQFSYLTVFTCRARLDGMAEKDLEQILSKISVAAALLLPLSFSTMFAVPGGYDKDTGLPKLRNRVSYVIYTSADMVAFIAALVILISCTFGIRKRISKIKRTRLSIRLIQIALVATSVAFVSGIVAITDSFSFSLSYSFLGQSRFIFLMVICTFVVIISFTLSRVFVTLRCFS